MLCPRYNPRPETALSGSHIWVEEHQNNYYIYSQCVLISSI